LQGVAHEDLTDEDKKIYEGWSKDNAERYFEQGPFCKANVIVLDDPQGKKY